MSRESGRRINEIRKIEFTKNITKYAEGSCLISVGDTKVICTATVDDKVPPFVKGTGSGWITAEYSMLPRATDKRVQREREKANSRSIEIQRLIGRSLRAGVDLKKLGERQIIIDCDVIQADGGTRCASITGGFVALKSAIDKLLSNKIIRENPIKSYLAAISCGIYKNICMVDFDYHEDSNSDVDLNFVINENNELIEIQGTGEQKTFSKEKLDEMLDLASGGIKEIIIKMKEIC